MYSSLGFGRFSFAPGPRNQTVSSIEISELSVQTMTGGKPVIKINLLFTF